METTTQPIETLESIQQSNENNISLKSKIDKPGKLRVKRKISDTVDLNDLLANWTQCCFFLPHKLRLCNVSRSPNSRYCGNHISMAESQYIKDKIKKKLGTNENVQLTLEEQEINSKRIRIPCPLDPTHTILKDNLESHIKICNSAKELNYKKTLNYYRTNCNIVSPYLKNQNENDKKNENKEEKKEENKESLINYGKLVEKINKIFSEIVEKDIFDVSKLSENEKKNILNNQNLTDNTDINSIDLSSSTLDSSSSINFNDANLNNPLEFPTNLRYVIDKRIKKIMSRDQTSFKQIRHVEQDIEIVLTLLRYGIITFNLNLFKKMLQFDNIYDLRGNDLTLTEDEINNLKKESLELKLNKNSDKNKNEKLNIIDKIRDKKNHLVLEYGAAKGLLGLTLHITNPQAYLIFVERASNRKKVDRLLTRVNSVFNRIRMDISHIYVPYLNELQINSKKDEIEKVEKEEGNKEDEEEIETEEDEKKSITIIAKHLCGVASDLAINSLGYLSIEKEKDSFYNEEISSKYEEKDTRKRGLGLATCCHHACKYNSYCGRYWLENICNITEEEFEVMKSWSGWASLGLTGVKYRGSSLEIDQDNQENDLISNEEDDNDEDNTHPSAPIPVTPSSLNLSQKEMRHIGQAVKRILDYGRVYHLRNELNMDAKLVKFCKPNLSPECYMIVASEKK